MSHHRSLGRTLMVIFLKEKCPMEFCQVFIACVYVNAFGLGKNCDFKECNSISVGMGTVVFAPILGTGGRGVMACYYKAACISDSFS